MRTLPNQHIQIEEDSFSEHDILIIGAGHFGRRAASILTKKSETKLWIIDKDAESFAQLPDGNSNRILCDGVDFLVHNFQVLSPDATIIPALPLHLASEWLKNYIQGDYDIRQAPISEELKAIFPHYWLGSDGSLLVSHADFKCPEDCPELDDFCTVTKKKRESPLYERMCQINLPDHMVHVIQSHQIAPGLGGYEVSDLEGLLDRVRETGHGNWLIGTACKCHGTITALRVQSSGVQGSKVLESKNSSKPEL